MKSYIELSKGEFNLELSKADEDSKFINFDTSDISIIKSNITKYKSYFTMVSSSNALLLRSQFKGYNIDEIIYCKIGTTSIKEFSIVKLDDEWYLIEVRSYNLVNGDVKDTTQFYKCDQIDGILDLLQGESKRHKIFNKEEFDRKSNYKRRINDVVKRIKSMKWEEFNKFYKQFMK